MNQTAVTIAVEFPRGRQRELEGLLRNEAPNAFAGVVGLHFLSLFVVRADPERDLPPLVCLEASFDGSSRWFLESLVRDPASRTLLARAFGFCAGCPAANANAEEWRAYLEACQTDERIFYVASPGHDVQQVLDEAAFADRVRAVVERLGEPAGRRAAHVRRVWDGLTAADRDFAMRVPPRPFWVRLRLQQRPVQALYGLLELPLFLIGLACIVLVAAQAAGIPLWPALAPPPAVLEATACWAVALAGVACVFATVWLALLLGEFPAELTARVRWHVFLVKLAGFVGATLRALPAYAALLGLVALIYWHPRLLAWFGLVLLGIVAFVLLVVAFIWARRLVKIARQEPQDRVNDMVWNARRLLAVCRRENRGVQTHFVSVAPIRPGRLRMATLKAVLWWVGTLAKILHNPHGLFNTQSIHFARWCILPGDRLMFISNYDGSFGGYLGIFATLGAGGVSAIWTNTDGFPRGFWLFGDGARDEQRFKCYARASQAETLLWYRRYPHLSVAAIERNAVIREDLARFARVPLDGRIPEAELDAFLRRFSVARP